MLRVELIVNCWAEGSVLELGWEKKKKTTRLCFTNLELKFSIFFHHVHGNKPPRSIRSALGL